MKKRSVPIIFIIAALILDFRVFDLLGITKYAPDCLTAVFAALALAYGIVPMALSGLILGLVIDAVANPYVGWTAAMLALTALAGGCLRGKYFADNAVIPGVTAAVLVFLRENIVYAFCKLMGRQVTGYAALLGTHMLPSAILTGLLCAGLYLIARKGGTPVERADMLRQEED